MNKTNTVTTVSVDTAAAARFDRLAKSNKTSKKDFFSLMLDYFEKYGINPATHESPSQEMQKLIKRVDQIVAFTKKQESDILRPLAAAVSATDIRLNQNIEVLTTKSDFKWLVAELNKYSEEIKLQRGKLVEEIQVLKQAEKIANERADKTLKALEAIATHLDEKGKGGLLGKMFG